MNAEAFRQFYANTLLKTARFDSIFMKICRKSKEGNYKEKVCHYHKLMDT